MLIWTGPCTLIVWTLVLLGSSLAKRSPSERSPSEASGGFLISGRAGTAGLAAAIVMLVFASAIRPLGPSGDEPHYLLIATSVLRDGDFDLTNDYTEERHLTFYPGPLTPRHVVLSASGHQYSFHGHGVAILTLPGLALGSVDGVRLTFLLISALGVAALSTAARTASASRSAPAVGVAALVCATPFIAQSSAIYPDGPGAAVVSLALLTTVRLERGIPPSASWLATTGAALALLPWLHLRFSLLSAAFALAVLWLLRKASDFGSNALVFLAAPVISATLWFASTWVMFETLDPTAPFRQMASGSLAAAPAGMLGLLVDHEYRTPALRSGVRLCRDRCGGTRQNLPHHCSGRPAGGSGYASDRRVFCVVGRHQLTSSLSGPGLTRARAVHRHVVVSCERLGKNGSRGRYRAQRRHKHRRCLCRTRALRHQRARLPLIDLRVGQWHRRSPGRATLDVSPWDRACARGNSCRALVDRRDCAVCHASANRSSRTTEPLDAGDVGRCDVDHFVGDWGVDAKGRGSVAERSCTARAAAVFPACMARHRLRVWARCDLARRCDWASALQRAGRRTANLSRTPRPSRALPPHRRQRRGRRRDDPLARTWP